MKKKKKREREIKMVKKVAFNAGHDVHLDPGAVSPVRPELGDYIHTEEAIYVKDIADRCHEIWEELMGQHSIVIQSDDLGFVCESANKVGVDAFVSIHCNSFGQSSAQGVETLYYSDEGKKLARFMQNELLYRCERVDRKIKYRGDLWVLKGTDMVAILVEAGFISNPAEESEMNTESFRQNLAIAICNALALYFEIEPYKG